MIDPQLLQRMYQICEAFAETGYYAPMPVEKPKINAADLAKSWEELLKEAEGGGQGGGGGGTIRGLRGKNAQNAKRLGRR